MKANRISGRILGRMLGLGCAAALLALAVGLAPAIAQTAGTGTQTSKKQVAAATAAKQPAEDANDLGQRVNQLEEQLVDMQVTVGTLESLAHGGAPAVASDGSAGVLDGTLAGGGGDLEGRVGGLEGQMQALSSQLADLRAQLEALNLKLGGVAGTTVLKTPTTGQQGAIVPLGEDSAQVAQLPADSGFGDVTVDPGTDAGVVQPLAGEGDAAVADTGQAPAQTASVDPAANPDKIYEDAYGLLLQQDYGGAEAGFTGFLGQFPKNKLAGNAQYWLGETYYVRGQYKDAAAAFLKGYDGYKKGQKSPDSLLKLAMSLSRLGQRDQACQAFDALDGEYPQASAQVKRRAQSERQRAGC